MASATPEESLVVTPSERSRWRTPYQYLRERAGGASQRIDDREIEHVHHQLQTFVSQHSQDPSSDFTEGSSAITRMHWVNSGKRSKCHNSKCKMKFTLTKRKHHCRKCGNVFCAKCLHYQRRLSVTAEYDPNGKLYMVCAACFNSETQQQGQARIWTHTFIQMRKDIHTERAQLISCTTFNPTRSHLQKECQRLVDGFASGLTSNGHAPKGNGPGQTKETEGRKAGSFLKKLSSLTSHVSKVPSLVKPGPPEWQKPDTWVSEGAQCQFCSAAFAYKKHNCKICGRLVCLACSSKDLLLYVPDKADRERHGSHARWAIIKILGCPEIEPDTRLYVRACKVCQEALESLQVDSYQASCAGEESCEDCMVRLTEVHANIVRVQDKIDQLLPKYKEMIDSLEIAQDSPAALPPSRNNMQVLAKNQGDLADHFTSFVVAVSRLKQLKPQTETQLKLVKALMKSKFGYYNDNMYTFRKLKRRLEQISPQDVLQAIQAIVDSQAMNSACLSIGQLTFEALHICLKHELSVDVPALFKETYEVCQADLRVSIQQQGEEWEERQKQIEAFIRMQLKGAEGESAPCRYLQPSRHRVQRYGRDYVDSYLSSRCEEVVGKVLLQLQSRCAYRCFGKSKESLAWLQQSIRDLQGLRKATAPVPR